MKNIVEAIICSQFDKEFGRGSDGLQRKTHAMKITFSLSNDYSVEEGYRHVHILIYGGGSNYTGVYGKVDWTVIRNEWLDDSGDGLRADKDYVKGETPWVLYGYHDSCWRSAVGSVLSEFESRIVCVDWVFGGWYKSVPVSEKLAETLYDLVRERNSRNFVRAKLADLDFKFSGELV